MTLREQKRSNEMALRGASERAGPDIGPWFYTSFDSECGECFGEIYEGDRARYVEGSVVCEECGEEADDVA